MRKLTEEMQTQITKAVYEFFAEECDANVGDLTEQTNILDELDGDSLMFLELVEEMKKKYNLDIQMQTLGKYILKNPVETLGETVKLCCLIYEKENDIIPVQE